MVNLYVWIRASFAAMAGLTFGYELGAINGVKDMDGFRETFDIDTNTPDNSSSSECSDDVGDGTILGLVVAFLPLGALIGALFAGTLADVIGRKRAIMVGGTVFALGGAIQAGAVLIWMVYLGRAVSGIGIGVVVMVAPVYIAELAPEHQRGRLVCINILWMSGGILAGNVVNLAVSNYEFGWRISLGLQALWGTIYAIGMVLLPETPRWLVKKGRLSKAAEVLRRVYLKDENKVDKVLKDIQEVLEASDGKRFCDSVTALFNWKVIERILLGMTLQFINRLAGVNVILYFSVSITCKLGVPPYISSVVMTALAFLVTGGLFFVDKIGRKTLILFGAFVMMTSMLIAATLVLVFRVEEGENEAVGYVVVVLITLFVLAFASTWPVTWVINSEIHPLKVKGISVSLTTAAFWAGNLTVGLITPVMLASPLQTFGTFYFLAGTNLLALLFVLLTLPETKGMGLEGINVLFLKPWVERTQILYYISFGQCRRHQQVPADSLELSDSKNTEVHSNSIVPHVINPLFEN